MKGTVISYRALRSKWNSANVYDYFKNKVFIILLGMLFILGVWIGSNMVYTLSPELKDSYLTILDEYILFRSTHTYYEVFYACSMGVLAYIFVLFICGFCAIAQPIIIAVPFIKGLGFGLVMVGIMGSGDENAMRLALSIMPGTVLSTLMTFFCCNQSYKLSKSYLLRLSQTNKNITVNRYLIKYAVYTVISLIGTALEAFAFYSV